MKSSPVTRLSDRAGFKPRAFTLVEVMMAGAVGVLVLAAVASILVMSLRMVHKNQQIDAAVTTTRLVQEHINGEMAIAISQTSPVLIRPTFSSSSGTTPPRYATMTYRVPIGSYGTVQSDTANTSDTIAVICPSDVTPQVGDYFLMDSPNLGSGIRITGVSGSGTVTLSLASTILAGTDPSSTPIDALASKLVRIQRERKYETVPPNPTTSPVTELHWYDSTINSTYVTLSTNVDASARYLFAQVPLDTSPSQPALEPSVSWQFSYLSSGSDAHSQGGDATYYQTNYAEGLIMPKSGNPLSASSYLGGGPTTLQSTTTSGTSTTLESTTTLGTSTTRVSTTLRSTTTSGTSTTLLSSTTLKSTTTQKSTTTTGTTLKSTTTQKSSTTLLSSTTLKSTTTQKSTTTTGTTLKTTTTQQSSTTLLSSTTTSGTTTVAKSSTSSTKHSTTTTIPFDG